MKTQINTETQNDITKPWDKIQDKVVVDYAAPDMTMCTCFRDASKYDIFGIPSFDNHEDSCPFSDLSYTLETTHVCYPIDEVISLNDTFLSEETPLRKVLMIYHFSSDDEKDVSRHDYYIKWITYRLLTEASEAKKVENKK